MPDLRDYRDFRIGTGTELDRTNGTVSPAFEDIVLSHIVGNYAKYSTSPLYLAIHGPMGNGKTFQTLRTCSLHHISMYYISAAELSGSYERDSIDNISRNLESAREKLSKIKEYSVFIIDDFHLSIASTEAGVGRTVNSQLLTGYLMNLADCAKQSRSQRIPFILLGNDFNNLYGPLKRDGRMDFFEWNPTTEDKIKIVCDSWNNVLFSRRAKEALKTLVNQYQDKPISFFSELKHDLYKKEIVSYVQQRRNLDIEELINNFSARPQMNEEYVIESLPILAAERHQNTERATVVHEDRGELANEQ